MPLDTSSSILVSIRSQRAPLTPFAITSRDRLRRALWNVVWCVLAKPSPTLFHGWRRFLARLFGAKVDGGVHIYPGAEIWAPWNLRIGARSCLANGVRCYNVAPITIGEDVVISQDTYLCAATHDYSDRFFPLLVAPITIRSHGWIAAAAFISPGVTVGHGAVVGARSVVTATVPEWSVVAGNPARFIKHRKRFSNV